MNLRHFFLLFLVCLSWGVNFVVSKWALTGEPGWVGEFEGVPPFFFAFMRFALLYAVLAPFLLPRPKKLAPVIGAGLTMGALQFAFIFVGLQTATPSAMAIMMQLGVPFITILSMIFLNEKVGWVRVIGMASAFMGISLILFKPAELSYTIGLLFGVSAALMAACGTVLIKQTKLGVISLQAWIGLVSWPPLLVMSLVFETDQIGRVLTGGWPFFWVLIFTVLVVNVFGHGGYYFMLKRYDASLIAPLTLMAPLMGIVFSVILMGDPVTWQLVLGGVITFAGVGVIAARRTQSAPVADVISRPR